MNKTTTIALSTLALVTTTAPAMARGEFRFGLNTGDKLPEAHRYLRDMVQDTGIEFKVNPRECDEKAAFGWYWAARNEFVICQENRRKNFGFAHEVQWTAEDLDTLRHEAQHLIQDCMDGSRQGSLDSVYNEPIELAKEVLGHDGIASILKAYSDKSDHIKVMELEAFSVAAMNDPREQSRDIQKFCFGR